jgi:hypothetical protein
VVKKDYNPVWNYVVPPTMVDTFGKSFKFEVYDWDKTGANDLIAKFKLDIMDILKLAGDAVFAANVVNFERVLPLKTKKGGDSSTITLKFALTWPAEFVAYPPPHRKMFLEKKVLQNKVYKKLVDKDINPVFYQDLMSLDRFDIVMVLDDSGSMNATAGDGKTRWQELKEVTKIAVNIGCSLDDSGIDLIFLNRNESKPICGVRSWKDAEKLFKDPPRGTTPLTGALKNAYALQKDRPLIVCVATDGVPNNMGGFVTQLKSRDPTKVFVSILACSDNDAEIGYLNKLDRDVGSLDVLDDYKSEKKEIGRKNKMFAEQYSLADHVARYFLGSVYAKYDKLDGL